MGNITIINPQEVLDTTTSQFFIIVWTSSKGTFWGTGGGGIINALHGGGAGPQVVDHNNAVQEYHNIARLAKSHPVITDGRIDLIELPIFKG